MAVHIIRKNDAPQDPKPHCDDSVFDGFQDAESVRTLLGWLRNPPSPEKHARARRLLDMYWHVYDMMIGERELAAQARDYLKYLLAEDEKNPPTFH